MKITIDTKQDTHEDIKKVIRLLTHLIGDHPTTNKPNIFEENTQSTPKDTFSDAPSTPNEGNIFGNMFSNPPTSETQQSNDTESEIEEKETPEIIPY